MLDIKNASEIYVYPGDTDMRYGIQGLFTLANNPKENTIHVFCSANRKTVKILYAEEGCVYLLIKRLTCGKYNWPKKGEKTDIDYNQLMTILDGSTIVSRIEKGGKIKQLLF